MTNHKLSKLLLLTAFLIAITIALISSGSPTTTALDDATCAPPFIATLRNGIKAELDQCYKRSFDHDGTTYDIIIYFTEDQNPQLEVDGAVQCGPDDDPGICEHGLPDSDIPGTDLNEWVLRVATQAENALPFYFDRGFSVIDPETVLEIWIGEDPSNGGIGSPNILKLDDEVVLASLMRIRGNVIHESQHLSQYQYDDTSGWQQWWGEGIADNAPDRADATYDAIPDGRYQGRVQQLLSDVSSYRSSDVLTIKYRSLVWWTWLMDQYSTPAESEPGIGWEALLDYYTVLSGSSDALDAVDEYLENEDSSSFAEGFVDYTLALYAYIYDPDDPRLTFIDQETNDNAVPLTGHTVVVGDPLYTEELAIVQPRSSQYWEYIPPASCPFVLFSFNEGGSNSYAFSVMTVDNGSKLEDRWTSYSTFWSRTVSTNALSRVVGVVTGLDGDPDGVVTVGHGCVTPSLQIKSPTGSAPAYVGEADDPRQFQVRLAVTGPDLAGVAGLTKDDFTVELVESGPGGAVLAGGVLTAAYVGDDYWLNVQAPYDFEGAQTGELYDLRVSLASISDTNDDAVLYEERVVDKLIVLDKSGSMANDGRITAAQHAAVLMTYELASIDQGAYIRYGSSASVVSDLEPMSGIKPLNMAISINTTNPGGNTSIGDGLNNAALEEDAEGIDANYCVIALLSDGYENTAPFWADVEDDVVDNNCFMDVIGLGSTANESLLEDISESSAAGGNYDFAQTSGNVPIDAGAQDSAASPTAVTANLSWQNNLSRIYDAIAARAAGRQQIMSGVGNNQTGANPALYPIEVDPTTDELVVSIAWQTPTINQVISLIDPDGTPLPKAGHQTIVEGSTAKVWRVEKPKDGEWTLDVRGLQQQFHVSASARTLLELHLYTGVPESKLQGVKVPVIATLSGDNRPILGAEITAVVTSPSAQKKTMILYDDGLHGDMDAQDGVYGGIYTQTTGGETVVKDPTGVKEGQEPVSRGSYLVQAAAEWKGLRREAQTAFFLEKAKDGDKDRIPDWWERENGMDPNDPNDGNKDPDGDGLDNTCEWQQGTDPQNPDSDGGGESDGSELPNCDPGVQDPLDAYDDRLDPLQAVLITPEANAKGTPFVNLWLQGLPSQGLSTVDIYRRPANRPDDAWVLIGKSVRPPTFSRPFRDTPPFPGPDPHYRIVPYSTLSRSSQGAGSANPAPLAQVTGSIMNTAAVPLSPDPYPPEGSILIVEGQKTKNRTVALLISASDDSAGSDGAPEPTGRPPGSPSSKLKMRLSTDPSFAGVKWQPFQMQVDGFNLGHVKSGQTVTVYVQFKDQAGNISEGREEFAMIKYTGSSDELIHLPIIIRAN